MLLNRSVLFFCCPCPCHSEGDGFCWAGSCSGGRSPEDTEVDLAEQCVMHSAGKATSSWLCLPQGNDCPCQAEINQLVTLCGCLEWDFGPYKKF